MSFIWKVCYVLKSYYAIFNLFDVKIKTVWATDVGHPGPQGRIIDAGINKISITTYPDKGDDTTCYKTGSKNVISRCHRSNNLITHRIVDAVGDLISDHIIWVVYHLHI